MSIENNEYLKQEDYLAPYNESIKKLKEQNPGEFDFDKLTYAVLSTPDGRRWLDELIERFLIPAYIHPNSPDLGDKAIYFEGYKQAFRFIRDSYKSHESRIAAETAKQ